MYFKNFYKNLSEAEIAEKVKAEGFDPIKISNEPGFIYSLHKHPETKLLAFLKGSMCVTVAGKHYTCRAGDKVIVPGNVEHSAKVDSDGCTFFWSEKLM